VPLIIPKTPLKIFNDVFFKVSWPWPSMQGNDKLQELQIFGWEMPTQNTFTFGSTHAVVIFF
jgi:hypothetical protein